MKEYKRHVLWLDYFNSSISRGEGRRIPLDRSVKDPKIDELAEAAKNLGYSPVTESLKHPKRMSVPSGCISVEKRAGVKKGAVLMQMAKALSSVRGRRAAALQSGKQGKVAQQQQQRR